jgi:hypothetical protein
MTDRQSFPVDAPAVKTDRLRPGVGLAYLLPGNASYDSANEVAEQLLESGRVYHVAEINRSGSFTQVALEGVTIPPAEGYQGPCYVWFDHALFAEAEAEAGLEAEAEVER